MAGSDFHRDWGRVSSALSALAARANADANADNFVIIEERETKKFVQFCYNPDPGLLLYLPQEIFSAEEWERATTYFSGHGVRGPTVSESFYVCPETGKATLSAGSQSSFNKELGSNVRLATQFVFDIFERVYLFPRGIHILIREY